MYILTLKYNTTQKQKQVLNVQTKWVSLKTTTKSQKMGELKMNNATYKQAELLEEGVTYLFKEDGNVDYVLERNGNILAATKREWAPDDPKAFENWVELAYMAPESVEDLNLVDLARDLDYLHEEMEDFWSYKDEREEQKSNGW